VVYVRGPEEWTTGFFFVFRTVAYAKPLHSRNVIVQHKLL
jgi:hypothetical protein